MARLEKHLQDRPCVLILDEIDKPTAKERDSIIYNFCAMPNVALICICNSRHFYYTLDSRVRSRLDAVLIEFKLYTQEQIEEILRQRAELGLKGEQTEEDIFQKIGQLANGDARVAIQTLRHAVSAADGNRSAQILAHHLKTAHRSAGDAKKKYLLAGLGDHFKVIYEVIRARGQIESGLLWKEYLNYCKKAKLQAAAPRTFSLYLKRLAELDLIAYRRALGVKGNIRIFEIRQ